MLEARLQRANDGSAAGSLGRMNMRQIALDEADLRKLPKAAKDARQQRTAGHRGDDMPRIAPTELLDDLEPHGLRAFGVIRPQVDVDESPAVPIRHLRAQT